MDSHKQQQGQTGRLTLGGPASTTLHPSCPLSVCPEKSPLCKDGCDLRAVHLIFLSSHPSHTHICQIKASSPAASHTEKKIEKTTEGPADCFRKHPSGAKKNSRQNIKSQVDSWQLIKMPNRLPSLADWCVRISETLLNDLWLHSSPDTPLHCYDTTWETVITLKINQLQQATWCGLRSASSWSLPTRFKTMWNVLIRSLQHLSWWVFLNRPSTFCPETQQTHLILSNVVAIHTGHNCLQASIFVKVAS